MFRGVLEGILTRLYGRKCKAYNVFKRVYKQGKGGDCNVYASRVVMSFDAVLVLVVCSTSVAL